ncbi:MAG TPA: efflux transporter outer membrane subunit, partial [Tepidisphaeraceae bacterium]|nr:efflux transporter outer membrane subunit [Tepidisphaeraceae bacterium]
MNRTPLGALAALCVAGCTVGPNYQPPKIDPGRSFAEIPSQSTTQPSRAREQPVQIDRWWETFHDPELNSLIERAVKSNPSLAQAEARIRQARYERIVAGAAELPNINAEGGYQHARGSKNIVFPLSAFGIPGRGGGGTARGKEAPSRVDQPAGSTNVPVGAPPPGGAPLSPLGVGGLPGASTDLFQAGLDASWELDIFGGVRRSVEAANADYQAAIEDRRDVYVTLMAEVALNYVELRGYQRQVAIAHDNLHVQQQSLALTEDRYHAGVTTQLDVSRAQAQVATTAAGIPSLDANVHQVIHRISVLLGEHPTALAGELSKPEQIPPAPPSVPVGVPTDLVRRRPDIRRAERQLAAATARVGVATAQLYPRLSLSGTFGFDATKFTHIADWSSRYYSIGPSIIWPIFDAGRIRANINIQNENVSQAMSGYEQTVLNALEDVENSLVAYSREQLRRQALSEAVDANRTAVDLANQQYRQGVVDFLTVLESERSLYGAQDALAQSDAQISGDLVSLYKALGGGW